MDEVTLLKQLADRIAPNPAFRTVWQSGLNGLAQGSYSVVNTPGPINQILCTGIQGTVYVYLGNFSNPAFPQLPDYAFTLTGNTQILNIMTREAKVVTLLCPSASASPFIGVIELTRY